MKDDSGLPLYSELLTEAVGSSVQDNQGPQEPQNEPEVQPLITRNRVQTLIIAGLHLASLLIIVWLANTSSSIAQVATLDMRSANLNVLFLPALKKAGIEPQHLTLKDTGLYEKYSVYTWGMCGQNEGEERHCHRLDDTFRFFPGEVFAMDSPELLDGQVQVSGPRDVTSSFTDKQMAYIGELAGDTQRGLVILGLFSTLLSLFTLRGAFNLGTHRKGQADILLMMVGFLSIMDLIAALTVTLGTDDNLGTTVAVLFNRATDPLAILAHTPNGRLNVLLVRLVLSGVSVFYTLSVSFADTSCDPPRPRASPQAAIPLQDLLAQGPETAIDPETAV